MRFLAKRANLPVPEEEERSDADKLRRRVLDLNRDAARWYYDLLCSPEGKAVQAYLDRRQIRKNIAVRFGMGASPDRWDGLLTAMQRKGYTKQELLAAGLVVNGKNGRLYDKFRNRLMLPVIDTRGDVVGFGSRVIDNSEPKYMNTTETITYSKRRILYGLNLAKKTKRPNIILCEGNLDVVTLHQAGFDNAVASMGTALTVEQTRLLSRFTKELVLCYDNDNAGQLATQRALELLNNSEFTVKVLKLPNRLVDGKYVKQDADDFIKNHGAAADGHGIYLTCRKVNGRDAEQLQKHHRREECEHGDDCGGVNDGGEPADIVSILGSECDLGVVNDAVDLLVSRAELGKNERTNDANKANDANDCNSLQQVAAGQAEDFTALYKHARADDDTDDHRYGGRQSVSFFHMGTPLSIPQTSCPFSLSLFVISHKLFLFKQLNFQKILP